MTKPLLIPQAFPVSEYRSRIEKLRTIMAERDLDLLIIDQFEHLNYFGGYQTAVAQVYQAVIVPLDDDPIAVIRALDVPIFSERSWIAEFVAMSDSEDPMKVVAETIKARGHGASTIGVEWDSNFLTVNRARELEALLPDARFADFSGIMWEMRQIKSALELTCLEAAAEICDRAMAAGFQAAQTGANEREVYASIAAEAIRSGADRAFHCIVVSGPRSAAMHGALGHRTLAEGDMLHVELAPAFAGYTSRIMRPKSIGAPSEEQLRAAEIMVHLQDEQIRAMKPGARACDVDRIVRDGVLSAGLRDSYTNVTGYTMGLVAPPRASDFTRVFLANSDWKLEENQVFHMYTSANGMTFSETVVVTPGGGTRLTKTERKLFS